MSIRELKKEDIPQLVDIVFHYKLSLISDFHESQKKVISQTFHDALCEPNTKVLVYLNSNGLIVGYINFHLVYYPVIVGKEVYVSDLLISENERGKGIGKSLISKAEQFAKENNCVRLMLNNPKESEGYKKNFYKKLGFTERTAFANFIKTID